MLWAVKEFTYMFVGNVFTPRSNHHYFCEVGGVFRVVVKEQGGSVPLIIPTNAFVNQNPVTREGVDLVALDGPVYPFSHNLVCRELVLKLVFIVYHITPLFVKQKIIHIPSGHIHRRIGQ